MTIWKKERISRWHLFLSSHDQKFQCLFEFGHLSCPSFTWFYCMAEEEEEEEEEKKRIPFLQFFYDVVPHSVLSLLVDWKGRACIILSPVEQPVPSFMFKLILSITSFESSHSTFFCDLRVKCNKAKTIIKRFFLPVPRFSGVEGALFYFYLFGFVLHKVGRKRKKMVGSISTHVTQLPLPPFSPLWVQCPSSIFLSLEPMMYVYFFSSPKD